MKPMKPHSTVPELDTITYPTLASPKLDGIRGVMVEGKLLSFNQKSIPNNYIRTTLESLVGNTSFDGEIMVDGDFNDVQSVVMSQNHLQEKNFYFNVFDDYSNPSLQFYKRLEELDHVIGVMHHKHVRVVQHTLIHNKEDLQKYWDLQIVKGYEGGVVRAPGGKYKFGRSTMKEGLALKLKYFDDSEGVVIDYEETMHNLEPGTNKAENMVPSGMLGALWVSWRDKEFKISVTCDHTEKLRLWSIRDQLLGDMATFKYQGTSRYGVPRFPVYKAMRLPE